MKKVLALVMTVAMLFSLAVIMPVSADVLEEQIFLDIENASFEMDEAGKTITGWTKGYEEAEGAVTYEIIVGGDGVAKGEKCLGIAGGNGGNKWISQEIEIPAETAAIMNEYNWFFKTYNTYCTIMKLEVYGAEGTTPVKASIDDFNDRKGSLHESILDITSYIAAVENPTKIKIELGAHVNNGGKYDDIRIEGVLKNAPLVSNGDFKKTNEDGSVVNWKISYTAPNGVVKNPESVVSALVAKNDGSGDNYVTVAPEINEEGANTGVSGAVSQAPRIPDNASYVVTVKYKALTDTAAYVKISIPALGWIALLDECLPASDADAATLEEAEWATAKRFISVTDVKGKTVDLDLALRAHPWDTQVGAWYDSISIEELEGQNPDSIIKNGVFEEELAGSSDIIGWEQVNVPSAPAVVTAGKGADGSNGVGSGEGYSGIRTRVNVTDAIREYDRLTLSYYFGYNGGGGMPSVVITAIYADGTKKDYKNVAYSTAFSKGNFENPTAEETWDITAWTGNYKLEILDTLAANEAGSVVKELVIAVNGGNCGGWWDNIFLTGEKYLVIDTPEGDIITNGSFEFANEGVKAIAEEEMNAVGWEQVGSKKYVWKERTGNYVIPAEDGGSFAAYGNNGAALKQTIELDAAAEYVTNHEKYRWNLTFSGYVAGGVPLIGVEVKAYRADGSDEVITTYKGADLPVTATWTMNTWTVDISSALDCFAEPVTKFDIILKVTGNEGGFEAVSLVPEFDANKKYPNVPIKMNIVNPSFEIDETGTAIANGGTITGWTSGSETAGWEITEVTNDYRPSHGTKALKAEANCAVNNYLAQEIEIPDDADYYVNMNDYVWNLNVTTYYIGAVEIIAYNSDKTVSASTTYSSYDGRQWLTYEWGWDVSDALTKVGKAKYVELRLRGNGNKKDPDSPPDTQPTMFDNIKLTATKKDTVGEPEGSIITNGTFETFDENDVPANWQLTYPDNEDVNILFNDTEFSLGGFGGAFVTSGTVGEETVGGSVYQTMEVEAGKYYLVNFAYKTADTAAVIEVEAEDGTKMLSQAHAMTSATAGDWASASWIRSSQLFKATETGEVKLYLGCVSGKDGVYYDNISVVEADVDESKLYGSRNLLVNGSFEVAVEGAFGLPGWTYESVPVSTVVFDERARDGEKALKKGFDTISQTVEITDYDELGGGNYGYKLDFSYGSYTGGIFSVDVDLIFEDESLNIKHSFTGVRVDKETGMIKTVTTGNKLDENGEPMFDEDGQLIMEEIVEYTPVDPTVGFPYVVLDTVPADVSIDLSFLTQSVPSPLKAIKITLPVMGTECWLDDFKLYAINNYVDVVDADGNIITTAPTAEDASITANAIYYGDAETVKLVLAVYNTVDEDTTEMIGFTVVSRNEEGNFEGATLEGLNLDGTQVIKAYLVENNMFNIIKKYEVK